MNSPYSQDSEKIDDYIKKLDPNWQEILEELRQITLAIHPRIQERFKYKVPFFGKAKDILFFNAKVKENILDIGFIDGAKLERSYPNISDIFESKHLKQVRHLKLQPGVYGEEFITKYVDILEIVLPFYED